MNLLLHDCRQAWRALSRAPGFVLVAVLTLGIGIGANTAVFSAIQAVLLRPLPAPDLDRLVVLREGIPELGITDAELSPAEVADFREQRGDLFDGVAGIVQQDVNLTGSADPVRLAGVHTYGDLFEVFGVRAQLGRLYTPEHSTSGADDVVVLSHGLWQRLTGGDDEIIGTTLSLDGISHEVIGVLPPAFRFPRNVDVYQPYRMTAAERENRNRLIMLAVARLAPDVTSAGLAQALDAQAQVWNEEYSAGAPLRKEFSATPLVEYLAGPLRLILMVLMGAVGLVLLIACANVVSLQLVRATGRARELAVRAALGAGRGRIARQLLIESALLAGVGGAVGVWFGKLGLDLLAQWDPTRAHALEGAGFDGTVLAFAVLLALIAAFASGVVPALRSAGVEPNQVMRRSSGVSADPQRHRMLAGSVVVQVALALVLLLASGLMIRSLSQLLDTEPGFRADRLVTAQLTLPELRYGDDSQRVAFYDALLERLRNSPGIEGAAIGWAFPFSDQVRDSAPFDRPGQAPPAGSQAPERHAEIRIVSADYFRTMDIPLLTGRTFNDADGADGPLVVLIDEFLAERHFSGEDPVGRQIRQFRGPATVIGVVGQVHHGELGEAPKELIYYHHRQLPSSWMGVAARTAIDPAAAIEQLRAAVRALDPELPLYDVATMEQRVRRSLGDRHLALGALGAFAALALLLAMLGVYGVMRYSTDQRLREIGVRVALGANQDHILRMVMRQGLAVTGLGIVLGLAAALVATRLMEGMLYGVGAHDPVTFAAVPVLLVLVAALACFVPARRAARADPMSVLRAE